MVNLSRLSILGKIMMNTKIELGDFITCGTDSEVYSVRNLDGKETKNFIAKITPKKENYMSFNLQNRAMVFLYEKLKNICEFPKSIFYDKHSDCGELLVMTKLKDFISLDKCFEFFPESTEDIIRNVAKIIATLHSNHNSGYGIEFYWNYINEKIVVLDASPMNTFAVSTEDSLTEHWNAEKENLMGRWNIISQIIPRNEAKQIFKEKGVLNYSLSNLLSYIKEDSVELHIKNVARTHALYIIGRIKDNRRAYARFFLSEYKKNLGNYSVCNDLYADEFLKAMDDTICSAKAKLYYSNEDTLCESSYECMLTYTTISWIRSISKGGEV